MRASSTGDVGGADRRQVEPAHGGAALRFGPPLVAVIGVVWMLLTGTLRGSDLGEASELLWRPVLTIAAIMVMTGAAHRLGLLERVAELVVARVGDATQRLFAAVFFLSALTAGVLNNDAAVLLLTPTVVLLVRRAYPEDPDAVVPYAFAVFMAAGVAPLVVSNPMNMIVAEFAGVGFNEYALHMLPLAVVGWGVTYLVLRWVFRRHLERLGTPRLVEAGTSAGTLAPRHWHVLWLLVGVLLAYPVVSYLGGPIWIVASAGAIAAVTLAISHRVGAPREMVSGDIAWDTLVFLAGVVVLTFGFRNLGLVDGLADLYAEAGLATIGVTSAVGSALINNHPMGHMNMLALAEVPDATSTDVFAALIGGDLGPRLLPVGSLAGLLWFASLRRMGVHIPVSRFVLVGLVLTPPALIVSLAILAIY